MMASHKEDRALGASHPRTDETVTPQGQPKRGDTTETVTPGQAVVAGASRPDSLAATQVTPTPPHDPLVGVQIGNYRVLGVLGGGGFGKVYKARDVKLGRIVALKFLRDPLEPKHRELFEREAKAIALLSKHANIVQIYEWGEYQGQSFFALEFLSSSADRLLAKHPRGLPLPGPLRIVAQIAEALDYAHEQGVLHRDVKPANLLLDGDDGLAKITDFGLTRFSDSTKISVVGTISGSPPYMSPEQAAGNPVDHRSDIFSLGVTLYELLSGERPFKGSSQTDILERIRRNQRTPLKRHRPDLPRVVLDIVEKATAHDPAYRYQTAGELAKDLRDTIRALAGEGEVPRIAGVGAFAQGGWLRRLIPAGAAAAVLVIALAIAASMLANRPGRGGPVNVALAQAKEALERGDAATAASLYRDMVTKNPQDGDAIYGLGYALLRQGDAAGAGQQFEQIRNDAKGIEGQAAVEYEKNRDKARPTLEAAQAQAQTAYPVALLAALDVAAQKYQDAVTRLADLDPGRFNFRWQYAEGLETLGQAYYRSGDYAKAKGIFEKLMTNSPSGKASVIGAYAQLANQQLDEQRNKMVQEKLQSLKEIIEKGGAQPTEATDLWTSRPLRFFMAPVDPGRSTFAVESGLTDVLPWMLSGALNDQTPLKVVNREFLGDVLAEQQLSAQLGSESGKLALRQVLGARLLIACKFVHVMNEDSLLTEVVDTETTAEIRPERLSLDRNLDADALVAKAKDAIYDAVRKAYPFRGMLVKENGKVLINIGSNGGITDGMQFALCTVPDLHALNPSYALIPDKTVVVQGAIQGNRAEIRLEGFTVDDIPADNSWCVIQKDK